uniref:Uncharacterized protein n=1 Tax=Trichuris muris TaxID=70415 RepID=A0A5S6QTT5_TRIMR
MDIPIEDEFFTALTHLEDASDDLVISESVKGNNHPTCQAGRPLFPTENYTPHRWHPNYLKPLFVAPRPANPVVSVALVIGGSLCRASLCLILILLFACFILLACLVRLVFYSLRHFTQAPIFNPTFRRTHCDPLWPFFKPSNIQLPRSDPDSPRRCINFSFYLLSIILEGQGDLKELKYILQHRVRGRSSSQSVISCCSAAPQPPWLSFADQAKSDQTSEDDFEQSLNNLLLSCQPHASASRAYLSKCRSNTICLNIIVQSTWSDLGLCPLKLLSRIEDSPGKATVAIEPKLVVILPCPFGSCWTRAIKLVCSIHDILSGPVSLLNALLERRMPVWNDAIKLKSVRQARPRRTAESWQITSAKVGSMDRLLKVCHLLRCNVQELLLSLLGGTLRRYFREMGIRCPPPINSTLLVDNKQKSVDLPSSTECSGILVPVKLPVDVDGVIPRVWEAQERLCRSLESAFPEAGWVFANVVSALLPAHVAQKMVGALYGASDGIITFLRVRRNLRLCKKNVRALLVFPIPDVTPQSNLKFACTFTVHSWDVYISLSVSVMHFHKPNLLTSYMEEEVNLLFRQVDPRLLDATQPISWPLGFHHPLLRAKEPLPQQFASQGDDSTSSPSSSESDMDSQLPTVAELENLLVEIRFELQELKRTVFPDRESYVSRLTYMQSKMEAFQNKLTNAKLARKLNGSSDEAARRLEALVNVCQPEVPPLLPEDSHFVPIVRSVRKKSKRRRSPTAMEHCLNVQLL